MGVAIEAYQCSLVGFVISFGSAFSTIAMFGIPVAQMKSHNADPTDFLLTNGSEKAGFLCIQKRLHRSGSSQRIKHETSSSVNRNMVSESSRYFLKNPIFGAIQPFPVDLHQQASVFEVKDKIIVFQFVCRQGNDCRNDGEISPESWIG